MEYDFECRESGRHYSFVTIRRFSEPAEDEQFA